MALEFDRGDVSTPQHRSSIGYISSQRSVGGFAVSRHASGVILPGRDGGVFLGVYGG